MSEVLYDRNQPHSRSIWISMGWWRLLSFWPEASFSASTGDDSLAQRLDPLARHLPYLLKPGADGGNDLKKSTTYES
jgi:hypothetical protein